MYSLVYACIFFLYFEKRVSCELLYKYENHSSESATCFKNHIIARVCIALGLYYNVRTARVLL